MKNRNMFRHILTVVMKIMTRTMEKGLISKGWNCFSPLFREHHKKLCSSPMWCHHLGEEHSVVVVVVGKKEPLVVVVVWKKEPLVGRGAP